MAISKDSFVKNAPAMPAASMQVAANSFRPPKDFLAFYSAITKFFADMKTAFDDENFERMVVYNIEIAKTVLKRLKEEKLIVVDEDFAENLDDKIAKSIKEEKKNIEKAIVNIINDKRKSKSKSFNDKKADLLRQVDKFKDDVLSLLSENFRTKKKLRVKALSEKQKLENKFDLAINQELVYYNSFFVKDIAKIIATPIIKPLNVIFKAADKLDATIMSNFTALKVDFLDASKKIQRDFRRSLLLGFVSIGKTVANATGKTLLAASKMAVKFMSLALKVAFTLKSVFKIVSFYGGLLLKPIKLAFSLASKTIGLAFAGLEFVVGAVYSLGRSVVDTAVGLVKTTASLVNLAVKAIDKFSIIKIVKNSFLAFFSTYPGAYALGYLFGKIWGIVLQKAGVSNEDIKSGNYSSLEVLQTLYERIKNAVVEKFDAIKARFSATKDEYETTFRKSKIGEMLINAFKAVKPVGTEIFSPLLSAATALYESSKGVVEVVKNLVRFLVGQDVVSLAGFSQLNIGTYAGLRILHKLPTIRGGLAGLLAVAITMGAEGVSRMFRGGAEEQKKAKYPAFVNVNRKTAKLVYGIDSEEGEEPGGFKYRTTAQIKRDALKPLQESYESETDENKKAEIKQSLLEADKVFHFLTLEFDTISDLQQNFSYMMEKYYEDVDAASKVDFKNVSLIDDILKYNGESIVDRSEFWNIFSGTGKDNQQKMFAFLAMIINARIDLFNKDKEMFEKSVRSGGEQLSEFRKKLEEGKHLQMSKLDIKEKGRSGGVVSYEAPEITLTRSKDYSASALSNRSKIEQAVSIAVSPVKKVEELIKNAPIGTGGPSMAKIPGQLYYRERTGGKKEYFIAGVGSNNDTVFDSEQDLREYLWALSRYSEISSANFEEGVNVYQAIGKLGLAGGITAFLGEITKLSELFQNKFLEVAFPKPFALPDDFTNMLTKKREDELGRLSQASHFAQYYKDSETMSDIAAIVFKRTLEAARAEIEDREDGNYKEINEILQDNNKLSEKITTTIKDMCAEIESDGQDVQTERTKILSEFKKLLNVEQ